MGTPRVPLGTGCIPHPALNLHLRTYKGAWQRLKALWVFQLLGATDFDNRGLTSLAALVAVDEELSRGRYLRSTKQTLLNRV